MKLLRFYFSVFKIAVTHSIEKSHTIVFFLVIAAGALGVYFPPVRDALRDFVVARMPHLKTSKGRKAGKSCLRSLCLSLS